MIAVEPVGRLDAEVRLPGSKSIAIRALVAAALARGESVVTNVPPCDDVLVVGEALVKLGATLERDGTTWCVRGVDGRPRTPEGALSAGSGGAPLRFLSAVSALAPGPVILEGSEGLARRPLGPLLKALDALGVEARPLREGRAVPLEISGGELVGGNVDVAADQSSQYVSALLLPAPYAAQDLAVQVCGQFVSRSYADLTGTVMSQFGATVKVSEKGEYPRYEVSNQHQYQRRSYPVDGDWSQAAFFLVAAAITGGKVTLRGIEGRALQADAWLISLLRRMGCKTSVRPWIRLQGGRLNRIKAYLTQAPDAVPALAMAAACAHGTTEILGVGHLRHKESDRLTALVQELAKVGIQAGIRGDGLVIEGGTPHGAEIDPHDDHRIAMAFGVLGLKVPGMVIRNPGCVSKSFPDFWEQLEKLGAKQ